MRPAQPLGPVLEGLVAAAALHRLDVTAGAPAAPGPGNDDRAAIPVGREPLQRLFERRGHVRRQRVQSLRAVQGQGDNAVFGAFTEIGHGVSPRTDITQYRSPLLRSSRRRPGSTSAVDTGLRRYDELRKRNGMAVNGRFCQNGWD